MAIKFQMDPVDLKYMMDVAKISTDKSRPPFDKIKCKIERGIITATISDTHKLNSIKLPCVGESHEPFLIPVITQRIPTKGSLVIITVQDDEVIYDFNTEKMILRAEQMEYPNIDGVIPNDDPNFETYVNPVYMRDAFKAFEKDGPVKIEFRGKLKPIIIKGSRGLALVLPVIK